MIMGISKSQLEALRKDEEPAQGEKQGPAWIRQGGSVLYRVEAVRTLLRSQQEFKSLNEERAAKSKISSTKNLGGSNLIESFNAFLNNGALNDSWDFTIIKGRPVDFIASLSLQIEDEDGVECKTLTLEEYLNMRLKAAYIEYDNAERLELVGSISGEYPEHIKTQLGDPS